MRIWRTSRPDLRGRDVSPSVQRTIWCNIRPSHLPAAAAKAPATPTRKYGLNDEIPWFPASDNPLRVWSFPAADTQSPVESASITTSLLRQAIEVRRATETLPPSPERSQLRLIERELLAKLGVGVSKRAAAHACGVPPSALDRWIARGGLPTVRRPGHKRRQVDTFAAVTVATEVHRLREAGLGRGALASAIRILDERGRLPRRLRPNESASALRKGYLTTTAVDRVRAAAQLSFEASLLADHGPLSSRSHSADRRSSPALPKRLGTG